MHLGLQLLHLLFNEASSEIVSLEGKGKERRALNVLQEAWRTIPEGCLKKL